MNAWRRIAVIGLIGVIVGAAAVWLSVGRPKPPAWLWWGALGLLTVLVFGVLLVALLGPGVQRMARAPQLDAQLTAKDRLDVINDVRSTILQSMTGFAVVFGLVFTAVGLVNTGRTLQTAQQGQITDRYTQAINQLGSDNAAVRLGGIYALERLSHDSSPDQTTIMKVLESYIRIHARDASPAGEYKDLLPVDVSAALHVIGNRDHTHDVKGFRIDLSQVDLDHRNLRFVDLRGANLRAADLRGADIVRGQLAQVALGLADLRGADLRNVDLTNAGLIGARLEGADLNGVRLPQANLNGADLRGAKLEKSDLAGASLIAANLSKSDLSGADLSGANLEGADLDGANLRGANLNAAKLPIAYAGPR